MEAPGSRLIRAGMVLEAAFRKGCVIEAERSAPINAAGQARPRTIALSVCYGICPRHAFWQRNGSPDTTACAGMAPVLAQR